MDDYDFGEVENVGVVKKKVRILPLLHTDLLHFFSPDLVLLSVNSVPLGALAY